MDKIDHQAEVKRLRDELQQAEHVQTELDRRVFYLKTLYDVSKDIFSSVESEKILRSFLLMAMGNFGVTQGFILGINSPDRGIRHFVEVGLEEDQVAGLKSGIELLLKQDVFSRFPVNEMDFSRQDFLPKSMAFIQGFTVETADAADILTVTVTATNNGTATAYNLRVLDDLSGRNLTFTGNVGGSDPPDTIDTTLGVNQPIFSWNPPNGIDPGDSISFTFDVRVDSIVQPEELLDNTIQADWTSLPGRDTALNSTGQIGEEAVQWWDKRTTGNGSAQNAGPLRL